MESTPNTPKQHIAVINGTSRTAKYIIQFGLASGLHVTSIVRSAARFNAQREPHENLTVAELADFTNTSKLAQALRGIDAVFVSAGAPINEPNTVVEDIIRTTIATRDEPHATAETNATALKVVLLSAFPVHPRNDLQINPPKAPYMARFLRYQVLNYYYEDLERAHERLKSAEPSKIEFAVVTPGMLIDVPEADDASRAAFENVPSSKGPLPMSYERLGFSMLSLLNDWPKWRGQFVVPEPTSKVKFGFGDMKTQRAELWHWVKQQMPGAR